MTLAAIFSSHGGLAVRGIETLAHSPTTLPQPMKAPAITRTMTARVCAGSSVPGDTGVRRENAQVVAETIAVGGDRRAVVSHRRLLFSSGAVEIVIGPRVIARERIAGA